MKMFAAWCVFTSWLVQTTTPILAQPLSSHSGAPPEHVVFGSAGVVVVPFSDVYFLGKPPYVRPAPGSTSFNIQPSLAACMRQCLRIGLCEYGTFIMSGAAKGQCWLASNTYTTKSKCGVKCTSFWKTTKNQIVRNTFLQRTVLYDQFDGRIANPERGFYLPSVAVASAFQPLNWTSLIEDRTIRARTLVQRYFVLDKFIKARISAGFLNSVANDFKAARIAGVKLILRFCYNAAVNPKPPFDATKSIVMQHLSQLEPLLRDNQDVIAVVEQGFVGLWGEGTLSTNFGLVGMLTTENWQDRREILTSLISMLPRGTFASVMAPWYKRKIFGPAPLTAVLAYSEMFGARTGEHDNCFVGDSTDLGTYHNKSAEYRYLSQESMYTPMGGRTCRLNEPRSGCAAAKRELELFHYDYMDGVANDQVLNSWAYHGCKHEIQNSLGYRFSLVESSFPQHVQRGGHFRFNIKIQNSGYSTPFHKRPVVLILRHRQDGQWCKAALDADPRRWHGRGKQFDLNYDVHTDDMKEQGFPDGEYEVLLHLPDRNTSLASRPEYSIHLANKGVWEPWSGFNKLMHTIAVYGAYSSNIPSSPNKRKVNLKCGEQNNPSLRPEPLLSNPSFEVVDNKRTKQGVERHASYWDPYNKGYFVKQGWGKTIEAHSGLTSVFVEVPLQGHRTIEPAAGLSQTIEFGGVYASNITISGWSKATGLSQSGALPHDSQYAVSALVHYDDGSTDGNHYAAFDRGRLRWQHASDTSKLLNVHKKISSVSVRVSLKGVDNIYDDLKGVHGGAWFDDIYVAVNGVAVRCPAGFYSVDNKKCQPCPKGFACNTLGKVEKCASGTFSMSGQTSCEPCPVCSHYHNRQPVCSVDTGQCLCTPNWSGFYCNFPHLNMSMMMPRHVAGSAPRSHWKKCSFTHCAVKKHAKNGVRVVVKTHQLKETNGNQHRCKRLQQPGSTECACECRSGGGAFSDASASVAAHASLDPWSLK